MPSVVRIFNGKMDKDTHPFRVKPEDYLDAVNVTKDSEGEGTDGPVTNIPGNLLVSYSGITSTLFKCIGQFPDKVRNRVYYFVWAANGHNQILFYNKTTNAIVKVLEDITDTGGIGILNFNPSWKINHIDIIYRDDGDLLFWTDGLNPPSKINVQTATSGGYGTVRRSYIDVAKEPPSIPMPVTYEDDATITVNNLRKRLWKFKYRYVFDDLEKSVWSSESEIPLPVNYTDTAVDKNPTKNARISGVFQTGAPNVTKIEIAAAQSLGNVFSDFFLVEVVDKAARSIPNDDIAIFRFFNEKGYDYVDKIESILDADWVPQKAYTQVLPNGNVLTYGAITEGYDRIDIDATTTSSHEPERTTKFPFIFIASQNGDSGSTSATGNIHIICVGVASHGGTFTVITNTGTISFTTAINTNTNDIIIGLAASAVTNGFTIVSQNSENLIVSKANTSLTSFSGSSGIIPTSDSFSYDWYSRYSFGILYRDAKGRQVGGVLTGDALSVQTIPYFEDANGARIPLIILSINNRPPIEATSFQIVRTLNLSKSNWLTWVSDRTFKDSDFAYISIANLTQFIIDNPTTVLSYSFTPGDRIRFMKQLSDGQNTTYATQDYEIQAQVIDPIINGVTQIGKFIKIALPSTDVSFDFGVQVHAPFPNPLSYNNYQIQLYTPALSVANGLNVYYEFGVRATIFNPGLATRAHQGGFQDQTTNLSQPAIFLLDKGDAYLRHRSINTGIELVYTVTPGQGPDSSAGQITIGLTNVSSSFNDPNILIGNSPYDNLIGFDIATNNDRWILKIITGTFVFRIKGTIIITFVDNRPGDQYKISLVDNTGNETILVNPFDASTAGTYSFAIDATFTLSSTERIFILGLSIPNFDHTRSFTQTNLTITREQTYNVTITDPNFSDFFDSRVTSNGRSSVIDPNSAQTYFPTKQRFSLEYQEDTNINQINRFFFDNQDTYDRSFGDIRKTFIEGRFLWVFQKFETGIVPVLTQVVRDVSGNPLEANSDQLLNKITYPFKGKYGIGDCPESFAYGKWAKYFFDNNKGVVVRISQDGPTPLSVLYKMNSFFVPKGPNFRKDLNNGLVPAGQTYMGDPAVYGVFDSFTNKYIIALEEINRYDSNGALTFHQDPFTIAFLETRDQSEGFESTYTYYPEMMSSLDNLLIVWRLGKLYTHNNPAYCNFFGVQWPASITGAFNDHMRQKKTWATISEDSDTIWECPEISTQLTEGTTKQESSLVSGEFKFLEGEYDADLKRNSNSPNGKINGSPLKGKYIIIKLETPAGTAGNFVFLNAVSVWYIDSPLTK